MRVLITGNQGYVGPVLGRHLQKTISGVVLSGLDTGYFAQCVTAEVPDRSIQFQIVKDVRDICLDDFRDIDAVVHLAAISNDPIGKEFEVATIEINAKASDRVARLAKEAGVKAFVFASSCSMYGAGSDAPRSETDQLNPLTAYARSKVQTEEGLQALADESFRITCLRFATAGGASPRLRLDLVLNDFVASAVLTGEIVVLSDGTPWRPLIHTKDMSRAIEWALTRGGNAYEAVNVGSASWTWQMKDLANDVARVLGNTNVSINTNAPPDKRSYKVNFSKFEKLAPHHQPIQDFPSAVIDLAEQVRKMAFEDENFRNSQFIRLNILKSYISTGRITPELRWMTEAQ